MEEEVFRLVSNANLGSYPDNTSNSFTNNLNPSIFSARSIGITKISVEIDPSKIDKKNPQFLNDNCIFFINCDQTGSTRIANQSVNSLNDFFINLDIIDTKKRIVKTFESDFLYIPIIADSLESIYILITNLNGEPHPCITGATIINFKFTEMETDQTLLRVVSTANKGQYPENKATDFTNSLNPSVYNVDSIALTKISLPLTRSDIPIIYPDKFNNEFVEKINIITKPLDMVFITIYSDTPTGGKAVLTYPVKIKMPTAVTFKPSVIGDYHRLDEAVNNTKINFSGWELGSRLVTGPNFKFSVNNDNSYNLHVIPYNWTNRELTTVTYAWYSSEDITNFTDGGVKTVLSKNVLSFGDVDPDNAGGIIFRSIFKITVGDIKDYLVSPPNENLNNDIIFVLLDNCEYISFGSNLQPIIAILQISDENTYKERFTYEIPYSCVYFLRTNTDILNDLRIRLVNSEFKPHPRVLNDKTCIATFVINHGSNTEVRESNYYGQLIG